MSLQTGIGICLVSALLSMPTLVHAQEEDAGPDKSEEVLTQAQALLSEANAFYAAERYDEARAAYQAAYDLTEAPGFLYNIAQSHRLAGQCRPAIEFYEKFLSLDPKTTLRSKVEGFVGQMWTCLEDEKKAAEANKEPEPSEPEPERAPEKSSTPEISTSEAIHTPRQSEGPSRMPIVGLAIAGTGVLALGTSVYFGLSSRSTSTEIESYAGPWGAAQEADEAEAQRFERFAIVLGVTGGAALVGGLATYLLTSDKGTSSVAVLPSEGGLLFAYSSSL